MTFILPKSSFLFPYFLNHRSKIIIALLVLFFGYYFFESIFLLSKQTTSVMEPTIPKRSLCLILKSNRDLKTGDIVVYKKKEEKFNFYGLSRLYELPNKEINLSDLSQELLLHDLNLQFNLFHEAFILNQKEYKYKVPENHVFLVSDNRANAIDSRHFGPVPIEDIIGKVVYVFNP